MPEPIPRLAFASIRQAYRKVSRQEVRHFFSISRTRTPAAIAAKLPIDSVRARANSSSGSSRASREERLRLSPSRSGAQSSRTNHPTTRKIPIAFGLFRTPPSRFAFCATAKKVNCPIPRTAAAPAQRAHSRFSIRISLSFRQAASRYMTEKISWVGA